LWLAVGFDGRDSAGRDRRESRRLVPEKDKEFGEKLCRKAFVWWSVALQRGNAVVQLNGVYRSNLANRQELGQGRPRRGPGR
jgi:hypothetical protein